MWFQIELPSAATVTEIQFMSAFQAAGRGAVPGARGGGPGSGPPPPPVGTFPRGYRVQLSMDGSTWGAPVAEGQGSGSTTVIAFPPAAAKFIRITQTGTATDNAPWSMQRLRLFAAPARAAGSAVR